MIEKQMLEFIVNSIDCIWIADTCQYCEEQIAEIQARTAGKTVMQELVGEGAERLRIVG